MLYDLHADAPQEHRPVRSMRDLPVTLTSEGIAAMDQQWSSGMRWRIQGTRTMA